MGPFTGTFEEWFSAKVEVADAGHTSPCWIWRASVCEKGYGKVKAPMKFARKGDSRKAHRLIYERLVGPVPEGLQLDHLCNNPACVNPGHLEPVTASENVRRCVARGRHYLAKRTRCAKGHEYTSENTNVRARENYVERVCLTCERERNAARTERRRASRSCRRALSNGRPAASLGLGTGNHDEGVSQ